MNNEFTHEDTGTRFTVRKPTVLEQLSFLDKINSGFAARWAASKIFIDEWESEVFPDKDADLSKITDGAVTRVIMWASGRIADYFLSLGAVEKNT